MTHILHWGQREQHSFRQHAWDDRTVYKVPCTLDPEDTPVDRDLYVRLQQAVSKAPWAQRSSSYGALRWSGGCTLERIEIDEDDGKVYAYIESVVCIAD